MSCFFRQFENIFQPFFADKDSITETLEFILQLTAFFLQFAGTFNKAYFLLSVNKLSHHHHHHYHQSLIVHETVSLLHGLPVKFKWW